MTHPDSKTSASRGLSHDRRVLELAFRAARMGVWECSLPGERLLWTDGVYHLFDLPRDRVPDRRRILECYSAASRAELHTLRNEAIRTLGEFELDAEITTLLGRRRWIRITATVEGRDGTAHRIFGVKRDITDEQVLLERLRYVAEHEPLTGLANRMSFQARLDGLTAPVADQGGVSLLLIDLDGFKAVNDTHGHAQGDRVLKAAAGRIASVCHGALLVARIGGDEFAVILEGEAGLAETLAAATVAALRQPIVEGTVVCRIGASIGVAHHRGDDTERLVARADAALYAAKLAGRNTFRVGEDQEPVSPLALAPASRPVAALMSDELVPAAPST